MAYSTRSDIEAQFGTENVQAWADLNKTAVTAEITARIVAAIAFSDAMVDGMLRGGPYKLTVVQATPPQLVINAAAALAGVWLYESRGIEDTNPETGQPLHRLRANKQTAEDTLRKVRAGVLRLSTDLLYEAHPQVRA